MTFIYNSKKQEFVGRTVIGEPGPRFSTDPGCCCCPCCSIPEGQQTYTCTSPTKKATCSAENGISRCDHETCGPDTCCNGACCQGSSCSIKADTVCAELGGAFLGCGTTCQGVVPCGDVCCPEGVPCVDGECVAPSCDCVDWCCAKPQATIAGQQLPYKTYAEWVAGPKPCNCLFDTTCAGGAAQFYGELSLDGSYDNDKYVFLNINFGCSGGVSTVWLDISDGATGSGTVPGVTYGSATAVVNFNCSGGELSFSNWQGAPVALEFASTFPCNPLP